jgi:predicted O-methyltransferase YrrM
MPPVLHNVTLVKGVFHETLPQFKEQVLKSTPIALLHIDCDIYASAKEIFDQLVDNIVSGTVIVLDEFYNCPGPEEHEFKAFQEFLNWTGKKPAYLAYNQYFEQAVVRIA